MEVAAQDPESPRCRALPLELWERIICNITDSRYLPRVWLNFRRVSHLLKAATEHAFVTAHLQYTDLAFEPLSVVRDKDENKYTLNVLLQFHRLSDDGDRAIFAPEHPGPDYEWMKEVEMDDGGEETLHDHYMTLWKRIITPYVSSPEQQAARQMCPMHVLAVRRLANDTELPGLEADPGRMQLSVLWKPMLSLFFGEIEYQKWAEKVVHQHKSDDDMSPIRDMAEQVKSGQVDLVDYLKHAMAITAKGQDDVNITIRRLRFDRIMRKFQADSSTELREDELYASTVAPLAIKDTLRALDFAEFDDEYEYRGYETRRGFLYDGLNMEFDGKRETNEAAEDLGIEVHWHENNNHGEEADEDEGFGYEEEYEYEGYGYGEYGYGEYGYGEYEYGEFGYGGYEYVDEDEYEHDEEGEGSADKEGSGHEERESEETGKIKI